MHGHPDVTHPAVAEGHEPLGVQALGVPRQLGDLAGREAPGQFGMVAEERAQR